MHVAGVEVTVGREEVTSITAAVEEIQPTPSITMSSTDIMEFGEKLCIYVADDPVGETGCSTNGIKAEPVHFYILYI